MRHVTPLAKMFLFYFSFTEEQSSEAKIICIIEKFIVVDSNIPVIYHLLRLLSHLGKDTLRKILHWIIILLPSLALNSNMCFPRLIQSFGPY